MLILSRPSLKLYSREDLSKVTYPAVAEVNVTMGPLDFFGVLPLTGKLNIVPVGATLEVKPTNFRGAGRLFVSGSYPKSHFSASFLGQPFALDGNIARFQVALTKAADLGVFVAYAEALFPAIFSGAVHAPIDVEDISGVVQGVEFTVSSSLSVSGTPLCTERELPLKQHFESFAPQALIPPIPLVAAYRYLQQADRLAAEGNHLTSYLSERMLNLAKALESLFPGQIDDMRSELANLEVHTTYAEVFSSVRHLRNQLDIGHVSFSELQQDTVQSVLDFAELATSCTRSLLNLLVTNHKALTRLERLRKAHPSSKVPNAVEYLKKYRGVVAPKNGDLRSLQKG